MRVYEGTSKIIQKCSDCRTVIDKFDKFYMFIFAPNKNNGTQIYLCVDCKNKLKRILYSE